jgi:hypothetical protein
VYVSDNCHQISDPLVSISALANGMGVQTYCKGKSKTPTGGSMTLRLHSAQQRTVALPTEHSRSCHSRVAVGYASDKRSIAILTASLESRWVLLGNAILASAHLNNVIPQTQSRNDHD